MISCNVGENRGVSTRVVPKAPQRFGCYGFALLLVRHHQVLLPRARQQRDFRERLLEGATRVLELFFFDVRTALLG